MTLQMTRRSAAGLLTGMALSPLAARFASAQSRYLDIRGGEFKPVPIAVTTFVGDPQLGPEVTGIITNNFNRSVFLQPINPANFAEPINNPDVTPRMDAWHASGAQFVVTGRAEQGPDGRLKAEFRLWDVSSGQQVAGQQYVTDPNNSRRIAHIISDAIFSRITGEGGFFDTRVVFVDETGPKVRRIKRLTIMDQDSANVRYLTRGDDLVVTPRFSPTSQEVAFMAFAGGNPKVYLLNIETGQREVVGNFPGMSFSPRFSPDGKKIIMSLQEGESSSLFVMDLVSRTTTRLTNAAAIDTSPCYSPDGSQITFESDRGGDQQIYVMPASGGNAQRITFQQGARFSTPVWSPKGDTIAFTRQKDNLFAIGVMKPDGTGMRILTEGFYNDGPTYAPNGLYLMFFGNRDGGAGAHLFMIDIFGRGKFPVPTPHFASDPAWSPLRT